MISIKKTLVHPINTPLKIVRWLLRSGIFINCINKNINRSIIPEIDARNKTNVSNPPPYNSR